MSQVLWRLRLRSVLPQVALCRKAVPPQMIPGRLNYMVAVAAASPSITSKYVFNQKSYQGLHTSTHVCSPVVPFKLSDIGEGIKEVTIKEWFVKEGDQVAQFDQICEVQSDKASVTITSRYDGTIKKIYYAIEDIAQVGQPLVDIEMVEGERSPEDEQVIQETDAIQVGRSSAEESVSLPGVPGGSFEKVLATPAVRRIASEYKIELGKVQGTGKDGRVLKEDVLHHINAKQGEGGKLTMMGPRPTSSPAAQHDRAPTAKAAPAPPIKEPTLTLQPRSVVKGTDRTETIKGYMKAMIKTMTAANEIPHFGYCDEINVTELLLLRRRLKDMADKYGIKMTLMPLFLKSASLALAQFPLLNTSLDLPNNSIIYKASHNIGIAMDTKQGLIVPNVKNVESKSILEIASDIQNLHNCALSGSVKPEDLRGGTFTISNIGSIGGTYAHPVILPPEVAIVALGKVQTLPRYSPSGEVVPVQVVNASFSCDHRVIDGASASRFSNLWKSYIEDPSSMLLHLQ